MSTTELTTQRAGGLALATFADAMKFGETVANSEFAPKDFRGKPASCMLAIQAGAEIGLAPLQALQSIAVVNGRPAVFGDAALAVVKASPVCEYVIETVDGDGEQMVATCTAQRRGYPQPTVVKFSVADAKKAGLWGKAGPWTQYPKRMLQMRARGFALRDAFPDVLKGLVTAEEAQDYPTPEPVRERVMVRPAGEPARPLTKSVKEVAPGITVAHVERFEPPARPATATRVEVADDTAEQKARLAINRATTLEDCDRLRDLIAKRHAEGVFTDACRDDLVDLLHGKAEFILQPEEVQA